MLSLHFRLSRRSLRAHDIGRVSHVRVAEWNDAVSSALEIESEGGVVTTVRVGPAEQTLPSGYITDGIVFQHPSQTGRSND